jgi:amino-acid N-acetyltransferase
MEDIVFGPATPVDLPSIRSLLDRCDLPTQDLKGDQLEQFVVCRAGSQLAGVVGVETIGELGLLRSLAVVPELRGRRLAHGLWKYAHDDAYRRRIRHLYLLTTTAERLFARWGFHRVARDVVPDAVRATAEFASLCPSSAVVMTLDLTAASGH